ncbi:MAG: hypothetical protein K2Q14_03410 [Gammaproteobacteria bacterium]|nr:hypothetical protein [Gammaproteobacteria bacterium]
MIDYLKVRGLLSKLPPEIKQNGIHGFIKKIKKENNHKTPSQKMREATRDGLFAEASIPPEQSHYSTPEGVERDKCYATID